MNESFLLHVNTELENIISNFQIIDLFIYCIKVSEYIKSGNMIFCLISELHLQQPFPCIQLDYCCYYVSYAGMCS